MNILFITSNRVGDAVLSTGLLASLIKSYPKAAFTIACGPYAAGLFRGVPGLRRLVILEKKSFKRHWIELWRLCIGTKWDLIVDLRNSAVSWLLRSRRRARPKKRREGLHKVIENAAVLDLKTAPAPELWLDDKAKNEAARLLPNTRPLLALGPAANWPCKQWPIQKFAELALKLTSPLGPLPGAAILVIADRLEEAQVRPLLNSIGNEKRVAVIGQDLLSVAAALSACRLFIGKDSGLMHIASAMGTPTLGLFGPGYEEIYGPYGPHGAFVRTPESRESLLARLPNLAVREPNLMESLQVDEVFEACLALLRRTA